MNPFSNYTWEQIDSYIKNKSNLNKEQLYMLFEEIEDRRKKIENELVDMGVPANAITSSQERHDFKTKFNKLVDWLGYIDNIT